MLPRECLYLHRSRRLEISYLWSIRGRQIIPYLLSLQRYPYAQLRSDILTDIQTWMDSRFVTWRYRERDAYDDDFASIQTRNLCVDLSLFFFSYASYGCLFIDR